jgi:hypothetical protein
MDGSLDLPRGSLEGTLSAHSLENGHAAQPPASAAGFRAQHQPQPQQQQRPAWNGAAERAQSSGAPAPDSNAQPQPPHGHAAGRAGAKAKDGAAAAAAAAALRSSPRGNATPAPPAAAANPPPRANGPAMFAGKAQPAHAKAPGAVKSLNGNAAAFVPSTGPPHMNGSGAPQANGSVSYRNAAGVPFSCLAHDLLFLGCFKKLHGLQSRCAAKLCGIHGVISSSPGSAGEGL